MGEMTVRTKGNKTCGDQVEKMKSASDDLLRIPAYAYAYFDSYPLRASSRS